MCTKGEVWSHPETLSQAFLFKLLQLNGVLKYVHDLSGVFTYIRACSLVTRMSLSFHQTSLSSPHQFWKEPLLELSLGSLTDALSSKHGVVILNQIFSAGIIIIIIIKWNKGWSVVTLGNTFSYHWLSILMFTVVTFRMVWFILSEIKIQLHVCLPNVFYVCKHKF